MIGPTDSSRAPAAIDVLSNAKVALISPANAASGLSTYRSGGYYFRTSAADVAQAAVLVKLAKDGGAKTLPSCTRQAAMAKACLPPSAPRPKARTGAGRRRGFTPGEAQQAAAAAKAQRRTPSSSSPGTARKAPSRS